MVRRITVVGLVAGLLLGGLVFGTWAQQQVLRIAHALALEMREKDFVEAARAIGMSTSRMLARHILPNIFG